MTALVFILMVVLGVYFCMLGVGLFESQRYVLGWFLLIVGACLLAPALSKLTGVV